MPRVEITAKELVDVNAESSTFAADSADVTATAADVDDKNYCDHTGREIIRAENTGGAPYTVTITSSGRGFQGRVRHVGPYTIGAGQKAVFGPFPIKGWQQSGAVLHFEAENAAVEFEIYRLPATQS